ncbi:MAG: DUF2914 domain-containing protein [Acidobacteriota bacterium]
MASFGQRLKGQREARGITLDEIGTATRIGRRYLEALEENDLSRLPGGAFARGFVRSYADFVGLDTDAVLEAYAEEESAQGVARADEDHEMLQELAKAAARTRAGRRHGPWLSSSPATRQVLVLGLAVGLALVVSWLWWRGLTAPSTGAPDVIVSADEPAAGVESAAPTTGPPSRDEAPGGALPARTLPAPPPSPRSSGTRAPISAAPPVSPPAAAPTSLLRVSESHLGTGVVHRQIVGESDRFVEGSQVYFWTRAIGGEPGTILTHVWLHDGTPVATVNLALGGPHWRTYSRKTLRGPAAGRWSVEARDGAGRVLARGTFDCIPDDAAAPSSG